jgi:hypothetical protein
MALSSFTSTLIEKLDSIGNISASVQPYSSCEEVWFSETNFLTIAQSEEKGADWLVGRNIFCATGGLTTEHTYSGTIEKIMPKIYELICEFHKNNQQGYEIGDACFIAGGLMEIKEVFITRLKDADGYYLVDIGDGEIIPVIDTGLFTDKNDCIEQKVLSLQKQIDKLNIQLTK